MPDYEKDRASAESRRAAQRANPQRDKDGNWYWNPIDAHAKAAARLAALTPAEAAIPACYFPAADKDGRYLAKGEFLTDTGNPQCQPLVTDNLNYFDKPRSVPQLLWVNSFGRCVRLDNGKPVLLDKPRTSHPPQGCPIHLRFWSELDWTRIAALLAP